jgi:nucleoside-diphosphate-sugar epimerase
MTANWSSAHMNGAKTVLVSGGAGFIGSHLARALVARGDRVRVIDDLSRGDRSRLADIAGKIQFIHGSILDREALAAAVRGVDAILHQGAWVSVAHSVEHPAEYHEINATGTLRVLEAARAAGVKRIIYASSSSAYGESPELPKRESMRALPISPYAVTKYTGELYMTVYAVVYGLQTLSLRYFNVFGPHQDPKSLYGAAIPAIVTRMLRGQRPIIHGDGEQTRDFCYIDNVVQANLLGLDAPSLGGEVVNIACGQRVSINQIWRLCNQIMGTDIQPEYGPPRPGDVRDSLADISLAQRVLGYRPTVLFEEGLRRSIAWYRTQMQDALGPDQRCQGG